MTDTVSIDTLKAIRIFIRNLIASGEVRDEAKARKICKIFKEEFESYFEKPEYNQTS